MQQAVEALEADEYDMVPDQEGHMIFRKEAAINALRERLAQPEQEPVAWRNAAIRVGEELSSVGPDGYYNMTAQQWPDWAMAQDPRGKNSLAQPEQEPKCGAIIEVFGKDWRLEYMSLPVGKHKLYTQQYNYTAPPQPLTDEEIWELAAHCLDSVAGRMQFARAIEAKLKAKNS